MTLNRRLFVLGIACISSACLFAEPNRQIKLDTSEGTWMSLDVSPDGNKIVFDLLGDIYSIDAAGGDAKRLTPTSGSGISVVETAELPNKGQSFNSQPRFSPDGKSIVFISDKDGADNLYVMSADGSNVRQLSTGRNVFVSPAWSPDGRFTAVYRSIVEAKQPGGIWIYQVQGDSGYRLDLSNLGHANGFEFSRDGDILYFAAPTRTRSGLYQIWQFDRRTGILAQITDNFGGAMRPRISPDGKAMAYATFEDGVTVLRIRDLQTGAERVIKRGIEQDIQFHESSPLDVLPNYAFSPDGRYVYLSYGGKIHRVSVADGITQDVPFRVQTTLDIGPKFYVQEHPLEGKMPVLMLSFPTFTADGSASVFQALGKIWRVGDQGGVPTRLTESHEREYHPSISPDGKWVAYVTWSDQKLGQVCKVSIDGGKPIVLTRAPGYYFNPNWSPDGRRIVVGVGGGAELRGEDPTRGLMRSFSWLPADGGPLNVITTFSLPPNDSNMHIQTAPDVGATFNRDGTRIWYTKETDLHSVRLDGTGDHIHLKLVLAGPFELSDVPTYFMLSPDERTVAFAAGNNEIWIMPMPWSTADPVDVNIRTGSASVLGLKRVSTIGGFFPHWINNTELSWTFAGKLYRYRLDGDKQARVTTVDVPATVPAPRGILALRGARIITENGDQVIPDGTIVIDGDRIGDIGPRTQVPIPPQAKIVDVSGKTIMPGLIDIHDHILLGQNIKLWPEQDRYMVTALSYGVTTFRDPAAADQGSFTEAELINSGNILGPRAYTTGEHLIPPTVDVHSLADALHVVTLQKDLGALMLKEYTQPTRYQRQLILEAAREKQIMSTAEGEVDYKNNLGMLIDGYTETEHLWALHPLYDDVGQIMAKTGYYYTPTLGTSAAGSEHWYARMDVDTDPKQDRFLLHISREHLWRRILAQKIDPEWASIYTGAVTSVDRMLRDGANVAMGSHDEPTPTGLGSHWEMWSYVEGGMTPLQAIHCATMGSAAAIGMAADLGSLEKGKLADLIILNANPLDNIRDSTKIHDVMRNGFLYDGTTLNELWPVARPMPPFPDQSHL